MSILYTEAGYGSRFFLKVTSKNATKGVNGAASKMAFMVCFNIDEFKKFIFESTFLSRFYVPRERIAELEESDVELMKFGFDWIKFFLAGSGPLTLTKLKR